jgi:hypothetical protein
VDDKAACKAIQELVFTHLTMVCQAAKEIASEVLREQMEAVEQRVRANLERIEKFKHSNVNVNATLQPVPQTVAATLAPTADTGRLSETSVPFKDLSQSQDQLQKEEQEQEQESCSLLPPIPESPMASPVVIPKSLSKTSAPPSPATAPSSDVSDPPPPPAAAAAPLSVSPGLVLNHQPSFSRSISLPIPNPASIILGGGNVIPIVSLQSLFIDTTETKNLFLRRFVTTQVISSLLLPLSSPLPLSY